jgi:SHS2 domain-containing protein
MVEWLGELVYRFEVDGLLFRNAEVRIEESGGRFRLAARARGEPYDTGRHPLEVQVKGVTYHELRVERRDGEWVGRVVLDI